MTRSAVSGAAAIARCDVLVVWIQNELRLQDHVALWSAVQDARSVIPLYVLDDEFEHSSPHKKNVIRGCLNDLDHSLKGVGGKLVIRRGSPSLIIPSIIAECGANGVYLTKQYEPHIRKRNASIRAAVENSRSLWKEFKDRVLFEEEEILTTSSKPHTVFTHYKNAWLAKSFEIAPSLPPITRISTPDVSCERVTSVGAHLAEFADDAGETSARKKLEQFLYRRAASYNLTRDKLDLDGTSGISHHLSTGAIGIRTVFHSLQRYSASLRGSQKQGTESFLRQLIWREFYYQLLANFPRVVYESFRQEYDTIEWEHRKDWYDAWREGQTGYPSVDAAMRQLSSEGKMHNRGRMIVASFLTKDLHVDWRKGEHHFMKTLADGDLALNNGGWQWCAGTGNDAQPWFRIFNPVLQGKRFDPAGSYIKRYLPELRSVPVRHIHQPWRMSPGEQSVAGCLIGKHYPKPLVDHDLERRRSLAMYGAARLRRRSAVLL
jgi:deoxyribodipyrimidine photo-lyase